MSVARPYRTDRITAAVGSLALQLLLVYGLIFGLSAHFSPAVDEAMKVFDLPTAPLPPPVEKHTQQHKKSNRHEGAASPRNLRARATDVVSPPPVVPPLLPPPISTARKPDVGNGASSGASNLPGPGMGAGGYGDGHGSGVSGDGDGDGWDTPPRHRSGRLKDSDYPAEARDAGAGGTVSVLYRVQPNGHVTDCTVTRSSGNRSLDETTCRLIEKRFRFDPARDEKGHPVSSRIYENHRWDMDIDPEQKSGSSGKQAS